MAWRVFSRRPSDTTLAGALLAGAMIVLIAVFGMTVIETPGAHAALTTAQSVEESLTCQCGCGLTIANCNEPKCEFAIPARRKIEAMVARGMTRVQIIAYFRKKYGEKILAEPTTHGFNLLAWTMPFLAVLCGAGVVMIMMGRWRGEPPSEPSSSTDTHPKAEQSSSDMRERLEREIKERI
jgi:cytochrome c-type biogenesis protein CcmH/NrfF